MLLRRRGMSSARSKFESSITRSWLSTQAHGREQRNSTSCLCALSIATSENV